MVSPHLRTALIFEPVVRAAADAHELLQQLAQLGNVLAQLGKEEGARKVQLHVDGHAERRRGDDALGLPPVLRRVLEVVALLLGGRRAALAFVVVVRHAKLIAELGLLPRQLWSGACDEHAANVTANAAHEARVVDSGAKPLLCLRTHARLTLVRTRMLRRSIGHVDWWGWRRKR